MKNITINQHFLNSNKTWFYTGILILFCTACTTAFDEFNTNPDAATEEMLTYDNLLTRGFFAQMEQSVFSAGQLNSLAGGNYQLQQNLIGDVYSGYMGVSNNWFNSRNNTTYYPITSWYGQSFNLTFLQVMPAWKQIQRNSKDTPHAFALAQIIKVAAAHRTTDIYGPLPYLKFGNGSLNNPYDSQEAIYNSFFHDLDSAVLVLSNYVNNNPGSKPLANYDQVYAGDYTQWIKFANSLKLRLAMRIAYVAPDKAKQYAESAVNNSFGVLENNNDNAYFKSGNGLQIANPLWIISNNFDDVRMGANMESFLKGYNDPRISAWFNTAATDGEFHGIRNGININSKADYVPFSKLNLTQASPVQWMVAAEMYFLKAEGALRGWNMGDGTAQSFYEKGIQTSFSNTGAGDASSYIANAENKPAPYIDIVNSENNVSIDDSHLSKITVKWDDGDDFETKLERIITQKWLAVYPDGQEAWSEFRRTRYPQIFPVVINNSGGLIDTKIQIRRMPFPQSEYQTNGVGVAQGVTLLEGQDNGGTKLWWDKKP